MPHTPTKPYIPKVGERVRFRSWKELRTTRTMFGFPSDMRHLCGTYARVTAVSGSRIGLERFTAKGDTRWSYSTDMIEPVSMTKAQRKAWMKRPRITLALIKRLRACWGAQEEIRKLFGTKPIPLTDETLDKAVKSHHLSAGWALRYLVARNHAHYEELCVDLEKTVQAAVDAHRREHYESLWSALSELLKRPDRVTAADKIRMKSLLMESDVRPAAPRARWGAILELLRKKYR